MRKEIERNKKYYNNLPTRKKILVILTRLRKSFKYGIKYLYSYEYRYRVKRSRVVARRRKRIGNHFRLNYSRIKWNLIDRDGWKCKYCKKYMYFEDITIDHIKRLSNGGNSEMNNLRLLHKKCHSKMHRQEDKNMLQ